MSSVEGILVLVLIAAIAGVLVSSSSAAIAALVLLRVMTATSERNVRCMMDEVYVM